MIEKNRAAQELGRLGGQKTAQKGSAYYKEISQKAVEARRAKKNT